jgi:hypothetical protein
MSDIAELGSLQNWAERNSESICRNMTVLIAIKAIGSMRLGIHEFPAQEISQAQHRMIRRILSSAIGSKQNKQIETTAYGDTIERKSLAIEIIGTITGDNGRTSVTGLSRFAASNIIRELIDEATKEVTNWGKATVIGITHLIEDYPCFYEREAYISRVAADMRNMRRTNRWSRSRYARSDNHTWQRTRELITRKSIVYKRELCIGAPWREEPGNMSPGSAF